MSAKKFRSHRNGKSNDKPSSDDKTTTTSKGLTFKGHTLADAQLFARIKTQQIAAVNGYDEIINRPEFTLNEPKQNAENRLAMLKETLIDISIFQRFQPNIAQQANENPPGINTPEYIEFNNGRIQFRQRQQAYNTARRAENPNPEEVEQARTDMEASRVVLELRAFQMQQIIRNATTHQISQENIIEFLTFRDEFDWNVIQRRIENLIDVEKSNAQGRTDLWKNELAIHREVLRAHSKWRSSFLASINSADQNSLKDIPLYYAMVQRFIELYVGGLSGGDAKDQWEIDWRGLEESEFPFPKESINDLQERYHNTFGTSEEMTSEFARRLRSLFKHNIPLDNRSYSELLVLVSSSVVPTIDSMLGAYAVALNTEASSKKRKNHDTSKINTIDNSKPNKKTKFKKAEGFKCNKHRTNNHEWSNCRQNPANQKSNPPKQETLHNVSTKAFNINDLSREELERTQAEIHSKLYSLNMVRNDNSEDESLNINSITNMDIDSVFDEPPKPKIPLVITTEEY